MLPGFVRVRGDGGAQEVLAEQMTDLARRSALPLGQGKRVRLHGPLRRLGHRCTNVPCIATKRRVGSVADPCPGHNPGAERPSLGLPDALGDAFGHLVDAQYLELYAREAVAAGECTALREGLPQPLQRLVGGHWVSDEALREDDVQGHLRGGVREHRLVAAAGRQGHKAQYKTCLLRETHGASR
jgi:hypothetical protein